MYFDSSKYGTPFSDGANTYTSQIQTLANGSQAFFNADTFQILCAGRDEVWGNDDDLSNFWPRTRREFEDSRKD